MSEWKTAMFFYDALKAMMDGKSIRRRRWRDSLSLKYSYINNEYVFEFYDYGELYASVGSLSASNLFATDWEVVEND